MSLFNELKRRNVFRVGIAYGITSWLLIQVADILFDTIGAPPWVMQAMFVILLAGLVIALIFAWAFMGEHDKALEASRRTMEMIPLENDHIYGAMMAQTYTFVLAKAGKRDEALERLVESLDTQLGRTRWELTLDPSWDFFRDDERFNELIRPKNLEASAQ